MATENATDVEMQSFDFSSFLREATAQRTLFPCILPQGPVKPVLVSKTNLPIFGDSAPDNHVAALRAALRSGNHYVLRVCPSDARMPAALVGIFINSMQTESNGGSRPFLGIAPMGGSTDQDISPVYRNGGMPLNPNKFKIQDAIDEGGEKFYQPYTGDTGESVPTYRLLDPLAVLYRNGPIEDDSFSVKIISNNIGPIAPPTSALVLSGGNLRAGTYKYSRVPVTSKGEQREAISDSISVTITDSDVAAGRRSIKLGWDLDDYSVRGLAIYRQYTPSGGTPNSPENSGRVAEIARTRVYFLDDTFRVENQEIPETTRVDIDYNFTLEVSANDVILENISFTFNTETEAYSAEPIDEAVNAQSSYISCKRLYTTKLVQDSSPGGIICYSTPEVPMVNGFLGADAPTEDDLEEALVPFLNRDRYRISALVDLGWCTPRAAYEFAKVEESQRSHTLLPVPYQHQSAQAAVAYAASLTTASRRSSIYTPWMYSRDTQTNAKVLVPASAFAAQAMHQSDLATAGGAGRSFAGLNRGVVDAVGVEDPDRYEYSDEERDLMAVGLVNYFRKRPNAGMTLWEDWTLQRNLSAASFVSVSRIWDIIQNAISDYLEYKLKEPNDDYNTIEIISGLNEYLGSHVLARNLARFEVIADERAGNNDSTADQGIRNVDVYLTPVIPVRRYRCRTILTRQGARYEDLMQAI